jgi:tol-pal system protein YbgF
MKFTALGVLLLAFVAAGCATRTAVKQLELNVAQLRADARALQEARDVAAQETEYLRGEVEAAETRISELEGTIVDAGDRLAKLSTRVDGAESAARDARSAVDTVRTATATPNPPAPSEERGAREAPTAVTGPAERAYAAALAAFRAREHGQAVLDFTDFIATYPRHPLSVNAQYWIAEAYYSQRDYRQASLEFQKVLAYGGTHAKAADALVKMGLCYASLRDAPRAQETWERVVHDYPRSDAAGTARALLRAAARR